MNEKRYDVHITTPNHLIVFRGRPTRTPAIFRDVGEDELSLLKTQIHKESIDATINEVGLKPEEEDVDVEQETLVDLDKDVTVEELYSFEEEDPKSTLEKLLKDEK